MPIYEYECGGCGRVFEEIVRSSDETICCPDCQSEDVNKLMSAPSAFSSTRSGEDLGLLPSSGGSCGSGGFS
jgi:putative FmdB family regulatory protein